MAIFILGVIVGACFAAALCAGRGAHETDGDIIVEPKRPTRVVRPWEHGGHSPNVPPIDWSKVTPPPTASALRRPEPNQRLKDRG